MTKKTKEDFEKIPPVEYNDDGEMIINLACDAANADWIRAGRKLREGKEEEVKELENEDMYRLKENK